MILYAVAAEQSLGRLFLAGIGPGLLLVALFSLYAAWRFSREHAAARVAYQDHGRRSAYLDQHQYTLREKVGMLPRVLPFVILLIGVMAALYGGYATPSETAGLGGVLALLLIAIVYHIWRPAQLKPILAAALTESTMLMFIIGMSLLFSYVMSYLHISQSAAEWIVALSLSKWVLLSATLVFTIVLGFFLPPVSIILMTVPIILPPLKAAGFDLVWFGILMTIVMEMGLIHPPVGLNIFVIKNIAPDIPLGRGHLGRIAVRRSHAARDHRDLRRSEYRGVASGCGDRREKIERATMPLKLATWNVNSLNVRLPRLLDWLAANQPDIIGLQETKLEDARFPALEITAAGYHAIFYGQRTYNGVAILSRQAAADTRPDMPEFPDDHKRVLATTIGDIRVVCFYVPNGQALTSDKYQYKLRWLAAATAYIRHELERYPRLAVVGDMNIAPEDRDVHDPALWRGQVLCSDAEREAFRAWLALGLKDAFRLFDQPEKTFSWWDYRQLAFPKNKGLRIDHVLLSPALAASCTSCRIDRQARKGEKPSDHAPVIAELAG